jgi:hypothetical protein
MTPAVIEELLGRRSARQASSGWSRFTATWWNIQWRSRRSRSGLEGLSATVPG